MVQASKFLKVLPAIEAHGRIYFRHLKAGDAKEEAIQEMRALGWRWFIALETHGKDISAIKGGFVALLAKAVNSGRSLTGKAKNKDVMDRHNQKRHGYNVENLPASMAQPIENLYGTVAGQRIMDSWEERLQDNSLTPVPEQAAFRIDFARWVKQFKGRDRRILRRMLEEAKGCELSREFGISAGRVTQLRREYKLRWERFHGADVNA